MSKKKSVAREKATARSQGFVEGVHAAGGKVVRLVPHLPPNPYPYESNEFKAFEYLATVERDLILAIPFIELNKIITGTLRSVGFK